jgi:hypothetical protein
MQRHYCNEFKYDSASSTDFHICITQTNVEGTGLDRESMEQYSFVFADCTDHSKFIHEARFHSVREFDDPKFGLGPAAVPKADIHTGGLPTRAEICHNEEELGRSPRLVINPHDLIKPSASCMYRRLVYRFMTRQTRDCF